MYIFGLCKLPVHELWSTVLPTVEVYPHLTRSSTRQPRSAGTFLSYIQHKSSASRISGGSDNANRLNTFLMTQTGKCDTCRQRKVKVKHPPLTESNIKRREA
jgi:hypothetical protein